MKRTRSPHSDPHLDDLIAGLSGQRVRRSSAPSAPRDRVAKPVDRFTRRIRWAAVGAGFLALTGITAFILVRGNSKQAKTAATDLPEPARTPLTQWSREQTAGTEAVDCLTFVLKGEGGMIDHLRPLEGIDGRLESHREELAALGRKTHTVGSFRLVRERYLMLPVDFNEGGMRMAWFERGDDDRWRLDLDSFLGLSDVPINSLATLRNDEPVLLRGISRPLGTRPAEVIAVRTPDGSASVKIWLDEFMRTEPGLMAALRQGESPVMMTVSRLATPVAGCSWKVERLLGKEWFLPVDRRTRKTASSR